MSTVPPPDLNDSEKARPVSPGTQSPTPCDDGKTEADRRSLSQQAPAATRSTFASICIVAACTSAQLTSIGLGPAFAISVPYAGKDLHIQKEDLQWILNAYSISSVNSSSPCAEMSSSSTQACFLLLCGRLADLYGRKRVWLVGYLILVGFGIGSGFAQCTFSPNWVLGCVVLNVSTTPQPRKRSIPCEGYKV